MNPHFPHIAQRAEHRCEYCLAPEAIFNFRFEVEHIIPACQQGGDEDDNRALACRSCNVFKATATKALDPDSQFEALLFHPRRDRWEEHFAIDLEIGVIQGKTAVGRATVQCLRMNSDFQQSARRAWIALAIYP